MRTRPVRADEMDLFVETAGPPDHRKEVEQYLQSMFAAGSMRPEWCFVIQEKENNPLGRVAFWTLPGMEKPLALVLLGDALGEARRLGAAEIEHVLDAPAMQPQFQHRPEKRIGLLEDVGFALRRETDRFQWRGEEPPAISDRLFFRTLEAVGEDAFVKAMRRVSEGTLDREIREEREARPAKGGARMVRHDPSWWRLAYDGRSGDLAGLVMPAEPPGFLTILYVGVVPEMRGRGYADDLLATGTVSLLGARAEGGTEKPLRADTDVANAPMAAAAFGRAGWARFAGRREYVLDLTSARA